MRQFWPLAMTAVWAICAWVAAQDEMKGVQEMRDLRKKLAHQKRRIIFNNDGDDVVYQCKEATPEALLACRTTPLLGSQVDTILYSPWGTGFCFTYNTKVAEIFDSTENPVHPNNKGGGFSRNKTAEFIKQGTDALKIMVDFCHKNHIEAFFSFRMNDTHDSWNDWYSDAILPQLKKDHPDWLMGSKENRPKHGGWSAMDYGRQEIRDMAVRIIEEVCQNYDVDGIEMDFCRHHIYFKGPAWGKDASPEDLEKMTDMVRRVRQVTEQAALKRGRPILVAVRVMDSADYCKAQGLDIVRWLEEGLVDMMVVSDYFRLNDWEVSVQLGHKYGVPVYPCLHESRISDPEGRKVRSSIECYRARAMNVWDSGADGVYMFNFFDPHSSLWREVGDPKTLDPVDKVYVVGVRGAQSANSWIEDGERRFLKRPVLSPERPMPLTPGETASVELRIGEEVRKEGGKSPRATLCLRLQDVADSADLSVKLNGQSLAIGTKHDKWFEYPVSPELVKKGANRVEFSPRTGLAGKPVLEDLQLRIAPGR